MKNSKEGISLITLIITIIVIIILAGVVILNLSQNNVPDRAREAVFRQNVANYKNELEMWKATEYGNKMGEFEPETVDATKEAGTYENKKLGDIIKSMKGTDLDKFEISEGKLILKGTASEKEKEWFEEKTNESGEVELKISKETAKMIGYEPGVSETLKIPASFEYEGVKYKVTGIDSDGFKSQSKLKTVNIEEGVSEIGANAFRSCTNLETVNIPASIEKIIEDPFLSSNSIENINIAIDNKKIKSIDGVVYSKSGKTLIFYPPGRNEEFAVPQGVEVIGQSAFLRTKITKISFSPSVKKIKIASFMDVKNMKSISIPSQVVEIGIEAFSNSEFLEEVVISANITQLSSQIFRNCENLNNVVLPLTLEEIRSGAFDKCTNLVNLKIPRNLKRLNGWQFYGSSAKLDFDDYTNISEVEDESFYGFRGSFAQENAKAYFESINPKAFQGPSASGSYSKIYVHIYDEQ